MPVSTRSNGYYAVRNGTMTGVYEHWFQAVQAGFRQQEGYGNAVKCDTREQAEEFIKMKPFSSSPVGSVNGYIAKQHFLVRMMIFTISMNVLCFGAYKLALKAEVELGCNDLVLSMLPMCKGLMNIRTQVTSNYEKLLNILFYQIVGGIFIASSWLAGLLN